MNVRTLLVLGTALGATGCVPPYRPPTASEPHATIKVRRVFEQSAGTHLDEVSRVGGRVSEHARVDARLAGAPRASAFLVHPRPATIEVGASFLHFESRTVQEPYTEQESYTDYETYSCGTGTSYRTCTRTVTRYRSVTKYRWVTKMVEVPDGSCMSAVGLSAQTGHIYVLDFTYHESSVCNATCFEQVAILSDGSFRLAPCPPPTAAELQAMQEDRD